MVSCSFLQNWPPKAYADAHVGMWPSCPNDNAPAYARGVPTTPIRPQILTPAKSPAATAARWLTPGEEEGKRNHAGCSLSLTRPHQHVHTKASHADGTKRADPAVLLPPHATLRERSLSSASSPPRDSARL
jgi:hypothetical protein